MAKIPQEKIDEIRQSVDIVDVIGQYLNLQKQGRDYKAICPFHQDSHPSLSISQSKQIYKCFVCDNGGNVFTFLQDYLHISFMEAVMQVAQIGHVDMGGYTYEKKETPVDKEKKIYYDMHQEAWEIYRYYLNTQLGTLAKDYCISRDFDEDTINTFGIGYAPSKPILYDAFKKLGYQEIDMVKSGLVIESTQHYDRFNDRVMFPLHDEAGHVVGFSGRIYKANQEGAKYINSPESEIFIKGEVLYNYHRAIKFVKEEGFVYINEGFMDVIAMSKAGHGNAIALMGTALTLGHVRMLKRLTTHIVLCLDGDAPGQAATKKTADFLVEHGFEVRIVLLPDGRDPDEILKNEGKDGLDAVLKERLTPIDFMLVYEYGRLDLNNYDDRRKLLDKGVKAISQVTDSIDQLHYMEKLSKLTQFSLDIIKEQLRVQNTNVQRPLKPVQDFYVPTRDLHRAILDKYEAAERNLLFYMLKDKNVSDLYEKKVGFMYNDHYRLLASYIVDYYRTHKTQWIESADLMNRIPQKRELINTLTDILELNLPQNYEQRAIDDYIKNISENARKMKKEQLKEQFNYVLDPKQKAQILKEMIELEKGERHG